MHYLVSLLTPGLLVGGAGIGVIVRLTRLIVAVEDLAATMKDTRQQVVEHEHRLTKGGL